MKVINKIILGFLIVAFSFSILPVSNVEASMNVCGVKENYKNSSVKCAKIKKKYFDSVDVLKENVSDIKITFVHGAADVSFVLYGDKLRYKLKLYEGNIAYGWKNASIIGVTDLASADYEVVCFRIERSADSITLMDANQNLAGKTVLYLGVSKIGSDEIIYIQDEINSINFDNILKMAKENKKLDSYSDEFLKKVEFSYVFGTDTLPSTSTASLSGNTKNLTEINDLNSDCYNENLLKTLTENGYEYGKKNYYEENGVSSQDGINTYSLFPAINDSIFKSITSYNKWTHVKDNDRPYSYWQYRYLGTNNPATIIVIFNWIHDYNSTNGLRNSLSIAYNETVIYNINTGALGCGTVEKNPVTVTSATIQSSLTQSSSKNCFLSLTQGETGNGTNISLSSLVSLTLTVYGNDKALKVLDTWNEIKSLATSSNVTTMYFYGTPEKQKKYYENGVINKLSATTKNKLVKAGDCINFAGATYITPSYTSQYSYTVSK